MFGVFFFIITSYCRPSFRLMGLFDYIVARFINWVIAINHIPLIDCFCPFVDAGYVMRESYMENWLISTWRIVYLDRVAWYISQYLEVITVQLKKYKFQIAVVAIYIWIFRCIPVVQIGTSMWYPVMSNCVNCVEWLLFTFRQRFGCIAICSTDDNDYYAFHTTIIRKLLSHYLRNPLSYCLHIVYPRKVYVVWRE